MNLPPDQRRKKVANLVAYAEQHEDQRAFVITVLCETTRRLSQGLERARGMSLSPSPYTTASTAVRARHRIQCAQHRSFCQIWSTANPYRGDLRIPGCAVR